MHAEQARDLGRPEAVLRHQAVRFGDDEVVEGVLSKE